MNMMVPAPTASDQPTQFEFEFDGTPIRGISTSGNPVFVAADLAKALHYRDAANMLRIVKPKEKGTHSVSTPGGMQRMHTVTEPGLYRVVMARTIATDRDVVLRRDVERFQDMVVGDILPTIRRTGTYSTVPAPAPVAVAPFDPMDFFSVPANAIALAARIAQRNLELEGQLAETGQRLAIAHHTIEEQSVTVVAHERLSNAHGGRCISDTAKHLGVGPRALFLYMRNPNAKVRWLIQRTPQSEDVVHQDRLKADEMASPVEPVMVHPRNGEPREKLVTRIYVTPRGLTRLARLIVEGKDPLLPVPYDMLRVVSLARGNHLFD